MARTTRSAARTSRRASSVSIDLSNVGKQFEPGDEYPLTVVEASLEEGQKAPYFKLKLEGEGDFKGSFLYHNLSTGDSSLWRLRPALEAFGIDIPKGAFDLEPGDFLGKRAIGVTYLDKYDGGSSIKIEDLFAADGDRPDEGEEADEDFDLDNLEDDEIEALAEALEVKGRNVAAKKRALAKLDVEDLAEAYAKLKEDEGDGEEFDLDSLDDGQINALAESLEIKARTVAAKKKKLAEIDPAELQEAFDALDSGDGEELTAEAIESASEDELEEIIERHELDVDLSEHKTLRKKRNAVLDAAEEAGALAE